ncbi:DUF4260 family protein [Ornithinicoccus halotolerans]|uniref:DUF4260 family protein n=1 Tax=Ornithinicoccus halotolerans TaxID=1748220 RepID=UPI001296FE57|nr:DUF4260 family protein [Ornithinicoccus halotolerans]
MTVWFQRAESAVIALAVLVAFVQLGFSWWWLLVLFLLVDVSMVGYLVSPRIGAWTYNAGHSYLGPAALAALAWGTGSSVAAFVTSVWAFHIAVDRLLGYGLKHPDDFTHTHLGHIGGQRARA